MCQIWPADGAIDAILAPPRGRETRPRDPEVLATVVIQARLLWEDPILYPVAAVPCETHSLPQTPNPVSLEHLPTWGPAHQGEQDFLSKILVGRRHHKNVDTHR